jgi:hypothetical protein
MKADERPSSRFKEQLRAGSQIPATGAYPEGPPIFLRVNQIAKSNFLNNIFFNSNVGRMYILTVNKKKLLKSSQK